MKQFALLLIFGLCACNPNKTILDVQFHPTDRGWGSRQPVWADEFNGTTLNTSRWVAAKFCGGYNGEQQCYRPQNISFSGGHMTLTAQVEGCDGDDPSAAANEVGTVNCPASDPNKADFSYTSARIHTRVSPPNPFNSWRYGRIEIRARLPYGQGTWPALWLMPESDTYGTWPRSGEIDIMETVNLNYGNQTHDINDFLQSNLHGCYSGFYPIDPNATPTSTAAINCDTFSIPTTTSHPGITFHKIHNPMRLEFMKIPEWEPDLVANFHTYAMEWSDADMRFFIDNRQIGRVLIAHDGQGRAPFNQPFYLIINLAVGGTWPGNANTSDWLHTPDRAELVLDWVRVYTCVPDPLARNCIYQGEGLGQE